MKGVGEGESAELVEEAPKVEDSVVLEGTLGSGLLDDEGPT
jgi:hypothetical protein